MNFLNNLKNNFYNPPFYAGLKERGLAKSFHYFFSIAALLSLVLAFVFGVELAPAFSAANLRKLVGFYPPELLIQIKGGVISTNVAEPYGIKEKANYPAQGAYTNFAVIDTKNNFSASLFKNYDTRVLVGKNFVVVARNRREFQFNDLSGMPDFSLSQTELFRLADLVGSYHWLISLALFVGAFSVFFGSFALWLVSLLVLALIILLFGKIKQVSLSYRNSYQIALHAVTIPLILKTVFILAGLSMPVPFFFSLITLIIALANLKRQATVL